MQVCEETALDAKTHQRSKSPTLKVAVVPVKDEPRRANVKAPQVTPVTVLEVALLVTTSTTRISFVSELVNAALVTVDAAAPLSVPVCGVPSIASVAAAGDAQNKSAKRAAASFHMAHLYPTLTDIALAVAFVVSVVA